MWARQKMRGYRGIMSRQAGRTWDFYLLSTFRDLIIYLKGRMLWVFRHLLMGFTLCQFTGHKNHHASLNFETMCINIRTYTQWHTFYRTKNSITGRQNCPVVKGMSFKVRLRGSNSLCNLLDVWLWTSYLNFLCLSFLIYRMG